MASQPARMKWCEPVGNIGAGEIIIHILPKFVFEVWTDFARSRRFCFTFLSENPLFPLLTEAVRNDEVEKVSFKTLLPNRYRFSLFAFFHNEFFKYEFICTIKIID